MEFIAHRINTLQLLSTVPLEFGVEIDLRDDLSGRIYMEHDPFVPGEDFEEYIKNYNHGTVILNVKSERIEHKVIDIMKKYGLNNYFFLDCSFPMIKLLTDLGETNIALRYSEYEGIYTIEKLKNKVKWVWVDCFSDFPLDYTTYSFIKKLGYLTCFVSPELQGQPEKIELYARIINSENIRFDAICCKISNISKWQGLLK